MENASPDAIAYFRITSHLHGLIESVCGSSVGRGVVQ
jgi:hypothetical protein